LAQGITPLAYADEGHIEAVRYPSDARAFGVQWHPEDTAKTDATTANGLILSSFTSISNSITSANTLIINLFKKSMNIIDNTFFVNISQK
jgi:gamma-glutamyl-gamma-aminobutyrate hydrolase PuuD